jgi:hypothetical protein
MSTGAEKTSKTSRHNGKYTVHVILRRRWPIRVKMQEIGSSSTCLSLYPTKQETSQSRGNLGQQLRETTAGQSSDEALRRGLGYFFVFSKEHFGTLRNASCSFTLSDEYQVSNRSSPQHSVNAKHDIHAVLDSNSKSGKALCTRSWYGGHRAAKLINSRRHVKSFLETQSFWYKHISSPSFMDPCYLFSLHNWRFHAWRWPAMYSAATKY